MCSPDICCLQCAHHFNPLSLLFIDIHLHIPLLVAFPLLCRVSKVWNKGSILFPINFALQTHAHTRAHMQAQVQVPPLLCAVLVVLLQRVCMCPRVGECLQADRGKTCNGSSKTRHALTGMPASDIFEMEIEQQKTGPTFRAREFHMVLWNVDVNGILVIEEGANVTHGSEQEGLLFIQGPGR